MEFALIQDDRPYVQLNEFIRQKRPAALATVIETRGSAPQVAGASALFTERGLACGTVGGGFLEAAVEKAARRAIAGGISRLRTFDLAESDVENADGICGGREIILIDGRPGRNPSAFAGLVQAGRSRRAGVLATFFAPRRGGIVGEIVRAWIPSRPKPGSILIPRFPDFERELKISVDANKPRLTVRSGRRLYLEPHLPPPRLVIAGGGHVGRAVSRLGEFLGFDVEVLDDRPEFASRARFPNAGSVIVGNIAAGLAALPLGPRAYVVIVTRGHRDDEMALRACIRRRAAYIGMSGTRRKIGLLKERFLKKSWASEAEWSRIHTPIGLAIGSKTVEEIAVSIAAELILVRSGRAQT